MKASNIIQVDNTVMILGGHDGSGYLQTIYRYDPQTEEWQLQNGRLDQEVTFPAAVYVNPSAFNTA